LYCKKEDAACGLLPAAFHAQRLAHSPQRFLLFTSS
jgi:hypothetical protein